nr:hypothetical protein [Tanacetum cinerariifolium]
ATVLAGETNVPTGSGFIPTAGPPATVIYTSSKVGPTASLIVRRRKGKEVMVESDTPKKKKLQEKIDAQVARELKEQQEREDMRMNEQIARDAEVARIHAEGEIQVWKQVEDFIPMGSKEEAERLKKKGINLEKEQNYMHAPIEWKLYDLSGVHHVTAKDKEIFMLVEKDYPLRRGLALVMISYT